MLGTRRSLRQICRAIRRRLRRRSSHPQLGPARYKFTSASEKTAAYIAGIEETSYEASVNFYETTRRHIPQRSEFNERGVRRST